MGWFLPSHSNHCICFFPMNSKVLALVFAAMNTTMVSTCQAYSTHRSMRSMTPLLELVAEYIVTCVAVYAAWHYKER